MAELFPESLTSTSEGDDQSKPTRSKRKITNILEWVQCFNVYVAVLSCKQPHKVVDLLGYQHLIIQANQEYQGDGWLGYDRRFCQRATLSRNWSTIDPTLWNLAFSGKGNSKLCSHCLSASHVSRDCEFSSTSDSNQFSSNRPSLRPQVRLTQGRRPLCFDWNETPTPGCPHPSCRFEHSCYYCARNPNAKEKAHKATNRVFGSTTLSTTKH